MKKIAILMFVAVLAAAMAVSAYADEFTPSVTANQAPVVVSQTVSDEDDEDDYVAVLRDANGNEIAGISAGDLVVTSVSDASEMAPEIKEKLDAAYAQIQSVGSLTELSADLESVMKEVSPSLTVDDLVVGDLLDVTVTGDFAEYLKQDGVSISVRFELSSDTSGLVAVLHNYEGSNWETIPNSQITRNADNTVDVVFNSLSPIAFVYDAGALGVNPDAPVAP